MAYAPYGPTNPDPNSPGQMGLFGLGGLQSGPSTIITGDQVAEAKKRLLQAQAPAAMGAQPAIADAPLAAPAPVVPAAPAKIDMFDKAHLSATLAQIAQGFAGSDSFAGGLAGAAGNVSTARQALTKGNSELGGPDNAFEIVTDPATGQKVYRPVAEIQSYLKDKEAAAFRKANTPKAPDVKDVSDMIGRAALAVKNGLPEPEARQYLLNNGIPATAIPTSLSAAYTSFGGTVPQAQAAEARERSIDWRELDGNRRFQSAETQRGINNGYKAQANGRANAAAARAARGGSRSGGARKGLGSKLPTGFILN